MAAEIVNLRRVRKAKARDQRAQQAEANRAKHGRTKAERQGSAAKAEQEARRLDGHRREPAATEES